MENNVEQGSGEGRVRLSFEVKSGNSESTLRFAQNILEAAFHDEDLEVVIVDPEAILVDTEVSVVKEFGKAGERYLKNLYPFGENPVGDSDEGWDVV